MEGEIPERDACGNKIKRRAVGLKDAGTHLLDFRDSWVGVEEQRVEMRPSRKVPVRKRQK